MSLTLTQFAGLTPPWNLAALDSNFSAINAAITASNTAISANSAAITALQNSILPETEFGCAVTGALTASITLSYLTLGPLVWVFTAADIIGNSNAGTSLNFSQFPSAIRTSANQSIGVPAYFPAGTSFGNFLSCVLSASTGVLQAFYGSALPSNTPFGFAKGLMFNYIVQ